MQCLTLLLRFGQGGLCPIFDIIGDFLLLVSESRSIELSVCFFSSEDGVLFLLSCGEMAFCDEMNHADQQCLITLLPPRRH